MNEIPASDSPSPSRLLAVFKSWLRARSIESRHPFEPLPSAAGRPNARYNGSVRVLVVDDNPVNRILVSELMKSRGLVPVLAADGAEAVTLACELYFDLILMDLWMPILDGLRATSAIRRYEFNKSRPAVPVVAYSTTSPGAEVLATHGLNGSLSKPCGDQELEDCLVRWCPAYRSAQHIGAHSNSRRYAGATELGHK